MKESSRSSPAGEISWMDREAVFERFEAAWSAGPAPDLAAFLPAAAAAERAPFLLELIRIDLEHRWQRGLAIRVEEYARRFPELLHDGLPPAELLAEEIAVRRRFHALPSPAELQERFGDQVPESLIPLLKENALPGSAGQPTLVSPQGEKPSWPQSVPLEMGRYQVLEALGRGGSATVYRAWDSELHRVVALKVPHREFFEGPEVKARFVREARVAAQLRHPGIVSLHEVGQQGDLTFLVYDFVPGPNLASLLLQTRPAPAQAAQWLAQLAEALDYAHHLGIIHRDVKPANIVMDGTGRPMLLDFGLAGHKDSATLTQEGDILGTPAYMSPEQARGQSSAADGRTDVYSLGVVLYEVLSGTLPFQGKGVGILHEVMHVEPTPPRAHRRDIPADLETICLKAMAKEPGQRFATAGEMAGDLRRYLNHEPIRARRIGPLARLRRWGRRNPALAVTIALSLALITLVAAFSFHRVIQERNRAQRLAANLALDQGINLCDKGEIAQGLLWMVRALELTPDDNALRGAILANLGAWQKHLVRPRSMTAIPSKSQILATSHDRRRLLLAWEKTAEILDLSGEGKSTPPLVSDEVISAAAFSPDDQTVVTAGQGGAVQFWDAGTGEARGQPIRLEDRVHSLAFEPHGQWLLLASAKKVCRYDPAMRRPLGTTLHLDSKSAILSPDGKTLLTRKDRVVERRDPVSGRPLGPPLVHDGPCQSMIFSPKGRFIAVWAYPRTTHIWDAHTGAMVLKVPHTSRFPDDIAFDPQERRLTAPYQVNSVRLWDLKTKEPLGAPLVHKGSIKSLAFSPQGHLLVTACTDQTVQIWDAGSGEKSAAPLHHGDEVDQVLFAPDGRTLVTLSARTTLGGPWRSGQFFARFWHIDTARKKMQILSHPDIVWSAAFSPCGRYILTGCGAASVSGTGCAQLWNLHNGQPVGPALPHPSKVTALAFAPDGKNFFTGDFYGNGHLCCWDTASGKKLDAFPKKPNSWCALACSPDGKWLVSGTQGTPYAQQWDARTRQPTSVKFLHDDTVRCAVFSPDSKLLLTGSYDKTARLWDAVTGQPRSPPFPNQGQVGAVDLSADGRWIITGNDYRVANIWDRQTGKPVGAPLQNYGTVRAVAFHPAGRLVLTGSWDQTARLWDRATAKPVGPPMRHDGEIEVAQFSPDGNTILTAGWDKTARLWPVPDSIDSSSEHIRTWIEVLTGMQLDESGRFHILDIPAWEIHRQKLQRLGGPLP